MALDMVAAAITGVATPENDIGRKSADAFSAGDTMNICS
jgi:hypothetical protein